MREIIGESSGVDISDTKLAKCLASVIEVIDVVTSLLGRVVKDVIKLFEILLVM